MQMWSTQMQSPISISGIQTQPPNSTTTPGIPLSETTNHLRKLYSSRFEMEMPFSGWW
jgi:hypothetical protein